MHLMNKYDDGTNDDVSSMTYKLIHSVALCSKALLAAT